jgi:hypothetical protein
MASSARRIRSPLRVAFERLVMLVVHGESRDRLRVLMRPRRIAFCLALVALMIGALLGGVQTVHAATTTTIPANYNYDRHDASAQSASTSSLDLKTSSAFDRAPRPARLSRVRRATRLAAESAEAELAGYSSFRAAKADLGSPGTGNVFDHVVEQSQIRRSGFAPEEIHHPFNLTPVSARLNQIKANYYSSKQPFTGGLTVRDWLNGQSFRDQYEFGMDVLTQIRAGTIK